MADFTSYKQLVLWIAKGSQKYQGRRMRSFMFRMVGDVVMMSHAVRTWERDLTGKLTSCGWRLYDFAEIRPNDMLTFTREPSEMVRISASLSTTLWRVVGLSWTRAGKGRYNMFHYEDNGKTHYWHDRRIATEKYEYFNGMSWNFNAGTCLNPRTPVLKTVNRERRKEWLVALKKFNRAFNTRLKMGIVDVVIKDWVESKEHMTSHISMNDAAALVSEALQTGTVTTDFIAALAQLRATIGWRPEVSAKSVRLLLDNIISTNSIRYRQEFGVLQK